MRPTKPTITSIVHRRRETQQRQLQTRPVESVRSYTCTLVVVFQRGGSSKYFKRPQTRWWFLRACTSLPFVKVSSQYQLRSYWGILLMDNTYRTKKTLRDRAFENVVPKVWNRLPLEIRQCQKCI